MKKRVIWMSALVLMMMMPLFALGEASLSDAIKQVADELELSDIEQLLTEVMGGAPGIDLKETLVSLAQGESIWDAGAILGGIRTLLTGAVENSLWRFTRLCAPALLCGVLMLLRSVRQDHQAADAAHLACYLSVCVFMIADLKEYMQIAAQTVARVSGAMDTLFPVLLSLLAGVGGKASAALLTPAITASGGIMTALMQNVAMKLATGTAVTTMLSRLSPKVRLERLSKLLRGLANWTMGISFTVFIGVTALQGLGAAAADGVSLRTAKYAVDNFVPVVGGMVADTMDTLVGCTLLIKNALGVTGLVATLYMVGAPMLRTLAAVLVYRFCAALLEPAAEGRIVQCIHDFSEVLMLLMTVQLSVGVMFILLIAQVLAAGNLTAMLR